MGTREQPHSASAPGPAGRRFPDQDLADRRAGLFVFQIPFLAEGIRIHGEKVTEALRPFHERMEACFKQLKEKVEKQYGVRTMVRGPCGSGGGLSQCRQVTGSEGRVTKASAGCLLRKWGVSGTSVPFVGPSDSEPVMSFQ